MVEIGDKLREGSEGPFGRALLGLAAYARDAGAVQPLEDALEELRMADAKYRLAVALNQAALLEVERDELELAQARAAESLPIARLLERPSEILLALALLAHTSRGLDDNDAHERHCASIEGTAWAPLASANARRRAELLLGRPLTEDRGRDAQ